MEHQNIRYATEKITGTINTTVDGSGITSSQGEKKKILWVTIQCSARQDNDTELWFDREKMGYIDNQSVPLNTDAYEKKYWVNFEIPVGRTFHASQNCGGTANNVWIQYAYILVG